MTTISLSENKQSRAHLIGRGLPRDIMRSRPFVLEEHCVTISSEVEGMPPKRVRKQRQVEEYLDLLDDPFCDPYVAVFASSPNDMKAKLVAAHLMERALRMQLTGQAPKAANRHLPLWHTINGSFQDKLREGNDARPSMLILSTVVKESSNVKVEKLRDILEQFSSIPRIVVLAGMDPVTFANSKLYMAMNHCLFISAGRRVEL